MDESPVMGLLRDGVPLALLVDLAGFGGRSEDVYRAEVSRTAPSAARAAADLVAVAS